MKTAPDKPAGLPEIVSQAEWQKALDAIRIKEKAATRASDALAVTNACHFPDQSRATRHGPAPLLWRGPNS